MSNQPVFKAFDAPTNMISYLVAASQTSQAMVIDLICDYDHRVGEVNTQSVENILTAAKICDYYMIVWSSRRLPGNILIGASRLRSGLGYQRVANVSGGIGAWMLARGPVQR